MNPISVENVIFLWFAIMWENAGLFVIPVGSSHSFAWLSSHKCTVIIGNVQLNKGIKKKV